MTETVLTSHNRNGNVGAMNILDYVSAHDGTGKRDCPIIQSTSERAGCSAGTLYMIAMGHKRPSALLAGAIEQATDGAVTRYDLRPDVFGRAPAPAQAEQGKEEAA